MWNGKNKAITFSFDDGCQQDIRLIEMMNKYNLKGTFNLNSGLAGLDLSFPMNGKMITRNIVKLNEIAERYQGHEVAVHSLHHPDLTKLSDEEILKEINDDQKNLEKVVGYDVLGMAYPGGLWSNHLVDLLLSKTSISYARTATFGPCIKPGFKMPINPYIWHQYYWLDPEIDFDKLIDEFLNSKSNKPQVLAIWGHSYEADAFDGMWEKWDLLFKKLSNHPDVFYGTNIEVLGK